MEGTPFGRYSLVKLLGRGGMGEVWRAHDAETDRIVAIKVLPANLSEDEDFQRRFRREAHAAARLNNPHVIPIHNYGEIDGRLYVDMRLIEGRDLGTVLADGPLDPARAVRIIDQVAKALHAAHEIGLLHRDIKPSNILLDRDDFAYLIDFGIARALGETRMTKSGFMIGTFHYIAPERLDAGVEEDARADIYSLACVLYECLTGDPPFAGDTMAHQVAAHLSTPPPRPSINQPDVPPQVDDVIATGMAKDPEQRYATTIELAHAARDAITVPIVRPAPTPAFPAATQPQSADEPPREAVSIASRHPRRPALIAAAVVVVVILAGGITGYFLRRPSTISPSAATARPVAESALDGLLLSPDQINTAMGTSGKTVTRNNTAMDTASDNHVTPPACTPMDGNLLASAYAGSEWSAFREQVISYESGSTTSQKADQGVVLFPSAHDAAAFFTASALQWPACSDRHYTLARPGKSDQVWTVGPVSNTNGTLSYTHTSEGTNGWGCQRALTVANNVVIDVATCSYAQSDSKPDSAVTIAHQIAAKVPTA